MIALALRYWHWVAIGLLAAALGAQTMRMNHAQTKVHKINAERADERTRAAQAAQAAESAARIEEQRRANAARKVIDEANTQTTAARADAAAAADAAAGLRQRVAALVAASRARAGNPAAAGPGQSKQGPDALDLLAGLLNRLDQGAGEIAGHAVSLKIAGLACERQYDSLPTSH